MKCPSCGAARLVHDTRDMDYVYKGEQTKIRQVTGDFCPSCGEVVLNREHGDRYSALVGDFQRQVNASHVDPAYIAKVRKKLDLDQREAAVIFGGGCLLSLRDRQDQTAIGVAQVVQGAGSAPGTAQ
jgi:HTH-type transcriptional regulator / antitoxin MqsA